MEDPTKKVTEAVTLISDGTGSLRAVHLFIEDGMIVTEAKAGLALLPFEAKAAADQILERICRRAIYGKSS